ncbi:TAT-variant-translocated molybdopterin oxidoreductase, partial [Oscillochloris sp. ZM17-4]|uniref:TAT-variant-translocated molybdopterin oxidoreductase n=1 Tax=Oscillochloris sp. ZM17-4 TaxID=2866714 RepID=UPI001C73A09B
MTNSKLNPDLDAVREKLHNARGPQLWRSLEQMADTPAFRELVDREFPQGAAELNDPVSRRSFLKLMGASLALAGISGCTYMPREKIAPFVHQPLGRVPGVPIYYASSVLLNGFATGVLVRSNDGRPTKIEPNASHPGSAGGTDLFVQAEILTMYDPDRSTQVLNTGSPSTWGAFTGTLASAMQAQAASGGAGLRLLTTTVTSPTLADQISQLLAKYPQARWYQYDPINRDNVYEGARLAFGEDVTTRYDFSKAQVVVSLDADFLSPGPGFAAYARAFADGRRVRKDSGEMNRLYVLEATPSGTGATADHRIPMLAGQVAGFAQALAARLGVPGVSAGPIAEAATRYLEAIFEDLEAHKGSSLVIAGDQQPPIVHALAHAINAELGNVGTTVIYTDPVEARPTNQTAEIANLTNEIAAGQVELLVIVGGNPAYNAPGDLRFAERLAQVPLSAHVSLFNDETSALATWHIPATHSLESWSDARAYEGTAGIIQPLIEPLFGGKTSHEILAALLGQPNADPLTLVQGYWQKQLSGDFNAAWQGALSTGLIAGTAAATRTPTLSEGGLGGAAPVPGELELVFRPDPSIWDGSYANNGWLMELPRPLTKLVWDNAALMSPRTAIKLLNLPFNADQLVGGTVESEHYLEQLSQVNGKVVRLSYRGGSIDMPLWLLPGHAENSITVALGYGRSAAGAVGNGVGVNVYPVRTSDALWFGTLDSATDTGGNYLLVSTQDHWTMEGRDIYRVGNFEEYKADPKSISKEVYQEEYGRDTPDYESLQPSLDYTTHNNAWGMTFNLSACIGCNACVVACQAENNIPVVGKEQVSVGREMQWLRIDRYFAGEDLDNPDTYLMPMACMQCEKAPCELVCPVAATVHDYEGLNNMVYNRCVGTKYCSNNCPYKVRRFNFLQYTDLHTVTLQLSRNPDVTVRNRGVMEKCTYCVQRISGARIEAKKAAVAAGSDKYTFADGAIVTACEAACPTEAIVFGDQNNSASRVASWKSEPHNYNLLGELNTVPRTTYLAR